MGAWPLSCGRRKGGTKAVVRRAATMRMSGDTATQRQLSTRASTGRPLARVSATLAQAWVRGLCHVAAEKGEHKRWSGAATMRTSGDTWPQRQLSTRSSAGRPPTKVSGEQYDCRSMFGGWRCGPHVSGGGTKEIGIRTRANMSFHMSLDEKENKILKWWTKGWDLKNQKCSHAQGNILKGLWTQGYIRWGIQTISKYISINSIRATPRDSLN
jgi:hypothetical protein